MVESDDFKKCNIIIAHGIVCCATSTNSQGERMRRRIARACVHWRPAQQPQDKNRIKCYKNQSLHCGPHHTLAEAWREKLLGKYSDWELWRGGAATEQLVQWILISSSSTRPSLPSMDTSVVQFWCRCKRMLQNIWKYLKASTSAFTLSRHYADGRFV